jgi:2'-5' RNA ligase
MAHGERLFFALLPPPAIQAELGRLGAWGERRCGGHAVRADKLHLTLLYLGELAADVAAATRKVAAGVRFSPFEVTLDRIEYWPGPRLYCAVPAAPLPSAAALATSLRAALRDVVALPERPFAAHVTLLRRPRRLHELPMPPLAWMASEFWLMSSRRVGGELRYLPLEAWSCV